MFFRKKSTSIEVAAKAKQSALYSGAENRVNAQLLEIVPDDELVRLNELLPWSAFINDQKGRRFGAPYSTSKRNTAQSIPDYRIEMLDERIGLKNKTVLEAGCFEGIHTIGLARLGAKVSAFDGRIENVVKTIVRCHMLAAEAEIFYWNLEAETPAIVKPSYNILHHVGVLYHLSDPISHLEEILGLIDHTVMLDTHVADKLPLSEANHNNFKYRFANFKESGREPPFAGLTELAKWVHSDDLVAFLERQGFENASVIERRHERNGERVLIIAERTNAYKRQ